ncbi:MAG TPA: carbohydrate kinase [Lachnospiraceae bacterium]|nr:carbohydrate kinase [Lachnospiraceae bacterium]HPF29313.1 carbohydrate kinase [Lachnospiraceae bacterium]
MKSYDIICAGEMLIDFTPAAEPYTFTANPGGAPANVAISTVRNGLSTAFLGILGNDDFGERLKETLKANQVTLLCPKLTDEAITTLAFVTLYENGERSFTFARKPGADILLDTTDVKEEDINACRMFHAGSVSLSAEPSCSAIRYAMELAHKNGKLVSFDINYRDMIWHDLERAKSEVSRVLPFVDLLKISDEELYFVGGEENIDAFMKQYGITVLIQTLGAAGARYYFRGIHRELPGLKVTAIDATGAGDAFWGGFLSKILMYGITNAAAITEEMIAAALHYGNVSGALCVQKRGGIPAIPTLNQITDAISSNT